MVHHGRCCRLAVSASEHVAASEWGERVAVPAGGEPASPIEHHASGWPHSRARQ